MKIRLLLSLPLFLLLIVTVNAADKPNIVFVFADDLAFDCVNVMGNAEVETPNLDRLAKSGVIFLNAYNQGSYSGAVCIASRMMLNSGRFLWDAQRLHNQGETERQAGRFWSEHLKKAGYDTYMTGKWHIKAKSDLAFDHIVNERPGMPNQTSGGYNRPIEGRPDPWSPYDPQFEGFWKGGKHWSEVLGDDAETFLKQAGKSDKPFFMYLAFNAPHDPRQAPKEYVDKYPIDELSMPVNFLPEYPYKEQIACGKSLRDEKLAPFPRTEYAVKVNRQEYYAIITHMDDQIGRILKALEATGKIDHTYIFFTADHGLAVGQHGLMGKQNLFDHSVRVPFFMAGPDVEAGSQISTAIYLQDVMPTSLELAGVEHPDHVRFKSVLPLLKDANTEHYDAIYGAYLTAQRSVTQDGFKLILFPKVPKALLFNLQKDPHEMNDLAGDPAQKPRMKKLFAKLLELQKETADKLDLTETFADLAK